MKGKTRVRYRVRQTFWSLGDDCEETFKTLAEVNMPPFPIARRSEGIPAGKRRFPDDSPRIQEPMETSMARACAYMFAAR